MSKRYARQLHSVDDLIAAVEEYGFLPFFRNEIHGFSIEALNYRKGGNTGFETCITRLQMQSYVCIADFVYMQDRYGRPYGWGVAEYATPEELFGYDFITSAYQRDPQEAKERMMQHLSSILPGASAQQLMKVLKG